jgi:hypothetical protein
MVTDSLIFLRFAKKNIGTVLIVIEINPLGWVGKKTTNNTVYILPQFVSIFVDITNRDKGFELFLFYVIHLNLLPQYFSTVEDDVDVDNGITK